ncbi:hypothetical protein ACMX2H_15865 [Arthrobacter sulfonylureivorans]|uniref:hypothetical protein n=1 Tax=Arthrobacter sulfonylureivorans TaxID=2486855 RepID=UPI0039E419B4
MARRRRDDDLPCPHEHHERAGIVTNQPGGYDPGRAHAAVTTCGRPECRAASMAWVQKATGEPATYISDASRKETTA